MGEFGHVVLAQYDGTCRFEAAHQGGVGRGDVPGQNPAGCCGPETGHVDIVLQTERNAMQGAPVEPGSALLVRLPCRQQRTISIDRNEAVQRRVVPLNPLQGHVRQFGG
jgi:hypothetical protein